MTLFPLSILFAHADQLVSGDALRIYYDSTGTWNDADAGAGFQANHGGTWVDWTYVGTTYMAWAAEYDVGGDSETWFANSADGSTNLTVVSESDDSTTDDAIATYSYIAGNLAITRTETWKLDERVMRVDFDVENIEGETLSEVQLFFGLDPDPDYEESGEYTTANDVADIDGDGADEWVESVGSGTARTLGLVTCSPADSALGHYADWSSVNDPDTPLDDEDGAVEDHGMAVSYLHPTDLADGEIFTFTLVISVEDDPTAAADAWLANTDLCIVCDGDETETWYDGVDEDCDEASDYDQDGDGHDHDGYGGDDCDDLDAGVSPSASEIWYDDIDQNCDDASDYDQDADGFESADYGDGDDCIDTDASVHPGATDTFYDGIDQDCDGASDYDADGDGYDAAYTGGDDCDDEDPAIHPGATETSYDGIDQDCAGDADEYDADGDGYLIQLDCDDLDASVNPAAEDTPDNGIDEDCDGADDAGSADDDEDEDEAACGCAVGGGALPGLPLMVAAAWGMRRGRRGAEASAP